MGERGPALPGCPRCPPPALGMRPVRAPRSAGPAAPPAGNKARSRSQAAGMGFGAASEAAPGAAALRAGKGCPGWERLPLPGYPPSARAAAGTRPGQRVHTDTPAPTTLRGGKGLWEGKGGFPGSPEAGGGALAGARCRRRSPRAAHRGRAAAAFRKRAAKVGGTSLCAVFSDGNLRTDGRFAGLCSGAF